jgi:cobalamin biosynthesis protein CobD
MSSAAAGGYQKEETDAPAACAAEEEEGKERTLSLPTGATVRVNDCRALVELPLGRNDSQFGFEWSALSSAVLNGGPRSFSATCGRQVAVLNRRVPSTYDGMNPDPVSWLRKMAIDEGCGSVVSAGAKNDFGENSVGTGYLSNTIGLMTAASMASLNVASRSAGGITVDAVVTAGISNSRAAGADADYFVLKRVGSSDSPSSRRGEESATICEDVGNDEDNDRQMRRPKPGTINSVVVVNGAALSPGALVEAYAIVIEAKCAACANYGLACRKDPTALAQGTGTDCAVLLAPSPPPVANGSSVASVSILDHAGKHTLLAEMVGQAVREATEEAILANIKHVHGNVARYALYRWGTSILAMLRGARPCIPPQPMMPVPKAPTSVLLMGLLAVLVPYMLTRMALLHALPRSATVLVAAVAWDRFLPEPPLLIHPVCLVGSSISTVLKWVPNKVYHSPLLGLFGGVALVFGMLVFHISYASVFLWAVRDIATVTEDGLGSYLVTRAKFCHSFPGTLSSLVCFNDEMVKVWVRETLSASAYVAEVALVKSTFSLQLLCTIALQMAKFLERDQLQSARSQLSWLCSRDPANLSSLELAGGTLESLSENLSDGTVAPFFWYVLLGPLGALGYRIVNGLDSRVGYRGGDFEWFGKASARLDDLLNLVPARLTAALLCLVAALVTNCSASAGLHVAWTDCSQCDSPNAGWPMGAMAGMLGVRLEKKGQYCLGRDICARDPTPKDVRVGHQVAQLAGGVAFLTAVLSCSLLGA